MVQTIRPHLTGKFADMMFAAETHPAMLRYLDQTRSVGPNSMLAKSRPKQSLGLNENLAREMIELHSMGVGADYTQQDVEELARLLEVDLSFTEQDIQRLAETAGRSITAGWSGKATADQISQQTDRALCHLSLLKGKKPEITLEM